MDENKLKSSSQTYLFQPGTIGIYIEWNYDFINVLIHYTMILNNDDQVIAKTAALRSYVLKTLGVKALCEFIYAAELLEIASVPCSNIEKITWKTGDGHTWTAKASSQINIQQDIYEAPTLPETFGLPPKELLSEYPDVQTADDETADGWSQVNTKVRNGVA